MAKRIMAPPIPLRWRSGATTTSSTIADGAPSPHDDILINVEAFRGAVRKGDWKLIKIALLPGKTQLFNLARDPGETTDVAAENPEMLGLLGLDASRIHRNVFAAGTALAMLAGALAAPLQSVYPNMGDGFLILSFVVVVIGGLGSIAGAFWAALLVGLIDTLGKAYVPQLAGIAVCGTMALVLLVRPAGLFGKA